MLTSTNFKAILIILFIAESQLAFIFPIKTCLEDSSSLRLLLSEIISSSETNRCFIIITDNNYDELFDVNFFNAFNGQRSYFYLKIDEKTEDLLAPHYQTVKVLKEIQVNDCDLNLIIMNNGVQVKGLLKFIDKYRLFNSQQKFVLLYDELLLDMGTTSLWSNFLSTILLKREPEDILTVSYQSLVSTGLVVTKQMAKWKLGQHLKTDKVFFDKTSNLGGISLRVAVFEHIPNVRRSLENNSFIGVEVEIVRALGKVLNFKPEFYESSNGISERWGEELTNGSFNGIIGQLINRQARIAIGDLQYHKEYFDGMDLSFPHSHECLTFLTPESSQDNSWKTLIQPFSGAMWAGVLLSLFLVGTVFYLISYLYALLLNEGQNGGNEFFQYLRCKSKTTSREEFTKKSFRDAQFRFNLHRWQPALKKQDLFDSYPNCILFTYSMLMYVALPRMPSNWPLRVLTGWYWMYCILLTVTYRASFTAILANPAPRITIDNLNDLAESHIAVSVWVNENKLFFDEAFDDIAQDIGTRIEIIDDVYGITERITEGQHAYFDNEYFLRYLRLNGSKSRAAEVDVVLHIMKECVVYMPVGLGLEKNSPLKPLIDKYIQRLTEGGLIEKWLRDSVIDLVYEEQTPQEALMNLNKMWSAFIALAVGYFLSICVIAAEKLHFQYVVRLHPLYDEYNTRIYYNFKRKYANI